MAVLPIIEYPDPRLRQRSRNVEEFDDALVQQVKDLVETLHASGGIGLSAPQTADLRRILVMDLSDDRSRPEVLINPEILIGERPAIVEESCLSLPGVVENVIRYTRIEVRAFDVHGQQFEKNLQDMHAVCLQHELDHLEGKLFVDRLPMWRRLRFRMTDGARLRSALNQAPRSAELSGR